MTELQLFSATYYSVNRHTTAEVKADLPLVREAGLSQRERKEDLLQNLCCCVTTAFPFTFHDEVFNRFV